MKHTILIFPHQLFEDVTLLKNVNEVYLIEENLFFNQYKFHMQKLVFHRASMKFYENYLLENKIKVNYIEAKNELSDIRLLIPYLIQNGISKIQYYDTVDNWLEKRINQFSKSIEIEKYPSHLFINRENELEAYFKYKKRYFQTDFYIHQRKKLNILIDSDQKPFGDKWSFDIENRLKYPKNKIAPKTIHPAINSFYDEAIEYVNLHFKDNYGDVSTTFIYPTTHQEAQNWLDKFLKTRFSEFGEYEDAIVESESILHHSVLTPMLNVGLLTSLQIINKTLDFSVIHNIPLNSTEGFIRQIIGWREFIRGVYIHKGTQERTTNFWKFNRKIPKSFYDGTTGIQPIDSTIKKLLKTGYCHHIERLMILGNFMVLCEFNPDEVYQWFMELFIDAYDWVMVPNVYGMSQFADGGLMATKPYISGSSYVLKMSDYPKGSWCEIWDALFWRFMHIHRNFFLSNPRLGILIKTFDKMGIEKQNRLLNSANEYLLSL